MKNQNLELSQSGSLFNFLMANNETLPVIGKGATILHWSDRHAYEVTKISEDGKTVTIQRYKTCTSGTFPNITYSYVSTDNYDVVLTYRKNGWYQVFNVIEFTKEFSKKMEDSKFYREICSNRTKYWNESGQLNLIEGSTINKKRYSKVNIVFGVKDEHFDPCF